MTDVNVRKLRPVRLLVEPTMRQPHPTAAPRSDREGAVAPCRPANPFDTARSNRLAFFGKPLHAASRLSSSHSSIPLLLQLRGQLRMPVRSAQSANSGHIS